MKSYIKTYRPQDLDRISKEAAQKEVEKYYDRFAAVITNETFAVVCKVLHEDFGFGKERLQKLKDHFEDEAKLIETGMMGKEYRADQVVEWLKHKFGIDLNKSKFTEVDAHG